MLQVRCGAERVSETRMYPRETRFPRVADTDQLRTKGGKAYLEAMRKPLLARMKGGKGWGIDWDQLSLGLCVQ
jgi:hypothetical protein